MRVNVYNEEMTGETEITKRKAANTGFEFYAVRLYLKSADELHHTVEDDDRSAVTFFSDSLEELHDYFRRIAADIQARLMPGVGGGM